MTVKDGLEIAKKYNLEIEYQQCIEAGYSPEEALEEWDIF